MNKPTASRRLRFLASLSILLALVAAPSVASATDFYAEGTAYGGGSSWGEDPTATGALHFGFEFLDIISVEALGRIGYAGIDQRMLMLLGIGAKVALPFDRVIPHLRVTALHGHEMSVDAMDHDTFGHVMGVGDGIRHRFGVEGAVGLGVVFAKYKTTKFLAEAETYVDAFPDELGPVVYGGGGFGFGVQVGL